MVTISWVFFRAETLAGAISMLTGMAGLNGFILPEKLTGVIPVFLSSVVSFQGGGIGSFPSIWGAVWIFALLVIIFFIPNTQEITSKYRCIFKNKPQESKLSLMKPSFFMPVILGLFFFMSIKIMLSVSDSEFLYFNF